ncbi:MAG: elongation factor 1-beta [Candidatus Aenigmarchaeota archaeon]|nr:elongation factor 1-beta [Candidatus Aenigmarchaeota archaeon]
MGQVIVVFRVMPESIDINLEKLEEEIKTKISPQKIERMPVAFGLEALKVTKLVEEKEGELERIENELKEIENVSEVDILEVSRSI